MHLDTVKRSAYARILSETARKKFYGKILPTTGKTSTLGGGYFAVSIPATDFTKRGKPLDKKEIMDFVAEVSFILAIEPPKIEYRPQEFFPTATMFAMCDSDGSDVSAVYVRENVAQTPDLLFSIAHELRHCWQVQRNPRIMQGYKEAQELTKEEYNLQPAEIDANAFAGVVMIEFFGIKPLFQGLPENVKDRIYDAMKNMEI